LSPQNNTGVVSPFGLTPFGTTRTRVRSDHALIGPDSHVTSPLVHWSQTSGVVLISPAMGAGPRAPRFVQYLAMTNDHSVCDSAPPLVQRFIYVLEGSVRIADEVLSQDSFAWMPAGYSPTLRGKGDAKLLVFEKTYQQLDDLTAPSPVIGNLADIVAEPFLGDPDAMLATLLPITPAFDMAVNVFTYQTGATLPFVETHVMEHGLYMRSGQGVYRLGESWYPVQQGDTIWMAAYCPQWFVAMGKGPASYIYYKDIHRDPLSPV
jgi:(S)-ureidoglycine aminohydrolase